MVYDLQTILKDWDKNSEFGYPVHLVKGFLEKPEYGYLRPQRVRTNAPDDPIFRSLLFEYPGGSSSLVNFIYYPSETSVLSSETDAEGIAMRKLTAAKTYHVGFAQLDDTLFSFETPDKSVAIEKFMHGVSQIPKVRLGRYYLLPQLHAPSLAEATNRAIDAVAEAKLEESKNFSRPAQLTQTELELIKTYMSELYGKL